MKKNGFFRIMAAFAAAAVLLLAGCESPGDSVTLSGSITISPSSGVTTGTPLTAVYSGTEKVTYRWNKNGGAITGAVQSTYTPPEAGSYTVIVSAAGYNPKTSAAVAVTGETLPALTGTLTIGGNAVVGRTLTAVISALNGTGTFSYQWKRGDTAAAATTDIPGANGQTYTLTGADKGKYIAISATRSGNSGSVTSAAAGPVTDPLPEEAVPGMNLAAKLAWLKENAQSDSSYLITIDKAETLAGADNKSTNYLSYYTYGEGNIIIRLTGERSISLSSNNNGPIFEIGSGVTLILDRIALYGVVKINSGGALEMGAGARITGNASYSGGVNVGGGTFTMNGGTISGVVSVGSNGTFTMNDGEISGNSGSGVTISGGTFTMNGGEISGNSGSGVTVSGGTFTMSGGEISGNTGAGVYMSGGSFTKTGGTITGSDAQSGNGYAAYAGVGKRRETTAGPGVALDSTRFGTAGGWDFTFTPLTVDTWVDGNIATGGGEQWFKFTATASPQYIHASFGTLTQLYVQVYNASGATVGSQTNLGGNYHDKYTSRSVTVGQEYYVRVQPYNSGSGGTYLIAFNTTVTVMSPDAITATTLTADTWADGSIATGGEQWFKFTATPGTQYIHASFGTLTQLYVQVYNASGATVGSQTILYSSNKFSLSVTVGQEYYVRVQPYSSGSGGTYSILFNATPFPPSTAVTTLSANTWADGSIAIGGEQWFEFTATASTQYIHVSFGTLIKLYVQVYNSSGVMVGSETELQYGWNTSLSVTVGQEYYVRVQPYSSGSGGTYSILFNAAPFPPGTVVTTLTVNTWADGSNATGEEQWFKFTATTSTQRIIASFGTLTKLYVQVYNSSGVMVGGAELQNNWTIPLSVMAELEYYIRVRTYSSGTYQICVQ